MSRCISGRLARLDIRSLTHQDKFDYSGVNICILCTADIVTGACIFQQKLHCFDTIVGSHDAATRSGKLLLEQLLRNFVVLD
jgi:hypothetical protein